MKNKKIESKKQKNNFLNKLNFYFRLYERYVRGQRTLRRLQCRRTHTAHLNEATRTRLLRELERERRYTVQDQICTYRKLKNLFTKKKTCVVFSSRSYNYIST